MTQDHQPTSDQTANDAGQGVSPIGINPAHALRFIFITILVDVIGFGIIIPVLPTLLASLGLTDNSEASRYGGWLTFAFAAMQFLCAPLLGGLSDRFGRRPVLLIALTGLGLDYILHAVTNSIELLFVGRILAGICGASFTTASAYIADVSTPEKRAQNFGLVGAAFGLGFIIGPVVGGLIGQFGPRAPFYLAAALSLLNVLYGYFVLPESLPKSRRRAFDIKRANPIGALKHLGNYPQVITLVVALSLIMLAGYSVQGVWTFYTKGRFNWDEKMIGYSLGVVGIVASVVQGGLIRVFLAKLGQSKTLIMGVTLSMLGLISFGLSDVSWMMFAAIIPYCTGNVSGPVLQGLISSQVPANEQGELQGALTSIMSLTAIIGPVLMTNIYAYFTEAGAPFQLPGAPFFLGAVLVFVAIMILLWSNIWTAVPVIAKEGE